MNRGLSRRLVLLRAAGSRRRCPPLVRRPRSARHSRQSRSRLTTPNGPSAGSGIGRPRRTPVRVRDAFHGWPRFSLAFQQISYDWLGDQIGSSALASGIAAASTVLPQWRQPGVAPLAVCLATSTLSVTRRRGELMKVGYVVLYVTDEASCLRFWTEQIGMVEKGRNQSGPFSSRASRIRRSGLRLRVGSAGTDEATTLTASIWRRRQSRSGWMTSAATPRCTCRQRSAGN